MMLERIDTRINMSDHFTKGLSRALFHQHADYSLGHIPPVYLPIYKSTIGTYTDQPVNLGKNVPLSFTTPMPAAAARVFYGDARQRQCQSDCVNRSLLIKVSYLLVFTFANCEKLEKTLKCEF